MREETLNALDALLEALANHVAMEKESDTGNKLLRAIVDLRNELPNEAI
jgi:hypothetical protein